MLVVAADEVDQLLVLEQRALGLREWPGGLRAVVAHVPHARLGGDREAAWDSLGAEHAGHLRHVRALAAEQIPQLATAPVERYDPLRLGFGHADGSSSVA